MMIMNATQLNPIHNTKEASFIQTFFFVERDIHHNHHHLMMMMMVVGSMHVFKAI